MKVFLVCSRSYYKTILSQQRFSYHYYWMLLKWLKFNVSRDSPIRKIKVWLLYQQDIVMAFQLEERSWLNKQIKSLFRPKIKNNIHNIHLLDFPLVRSHDLRKCNDQSLNELRASTLRSRLGYLSVSRAESTKWIFFGKVPMKAFWIFMSKHFMFWATFHNFNFHFDLSNFLSTSSPFQHSLCGESREAYFYRFNFKS